jgi:hypothetical protein
MEKQEDYQQLLEQVNKDQHGKRHEFIINFSFLDPYIIPLINDGRDKIMVYLILNILLITVPLATLVFLVKPFSTLLAIVYLVINYVCFLQRFILMLHFSEHKRLFKRNYNILNYIVPYFLSPFYGVPSGVYKLHHCVMHHIENNVFPWDISSTEPYDRSRVSGYLKYWAYWIFAIWFLTPYYLVKRERWSYFNKCVKNLVGFFVGVGVLYYINPNATFYVFLLPVVIGTLALSFGNYSQHIFINPSNPKSNYGLAYNCVNCPDNMRTFNDGYHIVHHIHSQMHWSELPYGFLKDIKKCIEEDAIVFQGIGFFDVGLFVVTGQFNKLAKHYVNIGNKYNNEEDIINMFKSRLKKI